MGDIKNNGGKREGAGRKPKADEQKLIEKLSPLENSAYEALKISLEKKQGWAIKLFFEYMYGKPKQQIEQNNTHTLNEGFDLKKLYDKEA